MTKRGDNKCLHQARNGETFGKIRVVNAAHTALDAVKFAARRAPPANGPYLKWHSLKVEANAVFICHRLKADGRLGLKSELPFHRPADDKAALF